MKVTVFKNITETSTPFFREVEEVLERIKSGNSKELVESIRKESEKEERNKLKRNLPSICFSGQFERREDKALVEHSGLICLDFDGFTDHASLLEKKKFLSESDHTMAVWISPSGDGLKHLVKIPANPALHKNYFNALHRHFLCPEFDTTSKNISRVCYESYDPEIYINEFSFVWKEELSDAYEEHSKLHVSASQGPTIRLDDQPEIVRRLIVWWDNNHGFVDGEKNNNLFKLAKAFCEYGIPEHQSLSVLLGYDSGGKAQEISSINKSAYKDMSVFDSKYFEDTNIMDEIKHGVKLGTPVEDIVAKVPVKDKVALRSVIEHIIELNSEDEFWEKNSKGKVAIVPHLFRKFLTDQGFYKYYHAGSDKFVFVRVQSNLIDDTTDDKIKDFVLEYLNTLEDKSIWNFFAGATKLFKEDFLSMLQRLNPKFIRDTQDTAHVFFQNCALRITKSEVTAVDYIDMDGLIWRKQIIDRDFVLIKPGGVTGIDCDYRKFINRVGGNKENTASIESTIGFLLHGYKPADYCPAVIITDEKISENPEGGTGKGILIEGIGKVRRQVIIDGKDFKFDKSFPYQTVSADTQILTYDDVVRNFEFERLFSIVTQGITLEKKNRDAIKVPFDESPKVVITSNYSIKGQGNSFERRKWEIEFKQYFNRNRTPFTELGRMMFSGWDDSEWNLFYNYMVDCLKGYLASGFKKSTFSNLGVKTFIANTSYEFYQWAVDVANMKTKQKNKDHVIMDLYNDFIEAFPDYSRFGRYKWSLVHFGKCLEAYGRFYTNNDTIRKRTAAGNVIQFYDPAVKTEPEAVDAEIPFTAVGTEF